MTSNPLKDFLDQSLPGNWELNEGEVIADALVLVRVVDLDSEGGMPERYAYTTSVGLPFATARGMITCIHEQMISFYQEVIDAGGAVGRGDRDDDDE